MNDELLIEQLSHWPLGLLLKNELHILKVLNYVVQPVKIRRKSFTKQKK
jgi:hypothetical protein